MDDLLSEKEQIEHFRAWWSEYGGYVIVGVAAGALLLFGFNYYQNSKQAAQLEASALYESLTDHVVEGELDDAELVADRLATEYESTIYSAQSRLAIARLYLDKNRDQDAADALRELLDSAAGEQLRQVARLRLARILLYQDKPQEVVDLLEGQGDEAFAAAFRELLGDAYHALGRFEEAQLAYQETLLDPLSEGTVDQQLVQWKVLDLPEVVADESADQSAAEAPAADAAEVPPETAVESTSDDAGETPQPDVMDEGTE